MVHKFNLIWSWFIMLITGWLPDMPATMRFRGWLFGVALKRKGKNFCVSAKVIIRGLENISIGNHVWLAPGVVMLAGSDITIEDEVMIGFNTVITDGNHTFKNGGYRFGQRNKGPIHIGKGSWIGANCTIVAGVNIGKSVLVGANSAVVKDLPDGVLAGGVPSMVIKSKKCL